MLLATLLAIFIVPVLYVLITRLVYDKQKLQAMEAGYHPNDETGNLQTH
jgi:HAE1 family hydrophobic/amphiphilic exporter-1